MPEEPKKIVPIPVLNRLFRQAMGQLKTQGIVTWQTEFMVTAVDCNGRPKVEWNVHVYCDSISKVNKALWAAQFKALTTEVVLKTLGWTQFWVSLDGIKPMFSDIDLDLPPEEFHAQMQAAKTLRASDIPSAPPVIIDESAPIPVDFQSADAITAALIDKLTPRWCGIGTKRCEPCSCEDK